MASPPSVVKFSRGVITFEDRSVLVGWTMDQLQRRALLDVGKLIVNRTRSNITKDLKGKHRTTKRDGTPRKHRKAGGFLVDRRNWGRFQFWARKKENDLIVGMEKIKEGAVGSWWTTDSELGTNRQPKRAPMSRAVQDNIDNIQKITSYYLSMLTDETQAIAVATAVPDEDVNE